LSLFHNSAAFITAMNVLQHSNFCANPFLASDRWRRRNSISLRRILIFLQCIERLLDIIIGAARHRLARPYVLDFVLFASRSSATTYKAKSRSVTMPTSMEWCAREDEKSSHHC
jgi:hypothetical protein